jgi:hypothetical protein
LPAQGAVALFPEKRTIHRSRADSIMRHLVARRRQNWNICAQMRPVVTHAKSENIRRSEIVRAKDKVSVLSGRDREGALAGPGLAMQIEIDVTCLSATRRLICRKWCVASLHTHVLVRVVTRRHWAQALFCGERRGFSLR